MTNKNVAMKLTSPKTVRPMSTSVWLHMTTRAISLNLVEAIAGRELFQLTSKDSDLIKQVNSAGANPGFNVISESLHKGVILALCRIWEIDSISANVPSLAKKLGKDQVVRELEEGGRAIDRSELASWQRTVRDARDSEELKALVRLRNSAIAHTQSPQRLYVGKARRAQYGDERNVLQLTIPIVERGNALIGYSLGQSCTDLTTRWGTEAKKFWQPLKAIARMPTDP